MARRECCREMEMAIFATRTNLPVSDFQTWQVCYRLGKTLSLVFTLSCRTLMQVPTLKFV